MIKKLTLSLIVMISLMLMVVGSVSANTIESSTMIFEGALTDNGDGTYSGTIHATQDFDVYAKEGSTVISPVSSINGSAVGSDHDAYPTWIPDVPDAAYNNDTYGGPYYALDLDGNAWELWYVSPEGSFTKAYEPMSGDINWNDMFATESGKNWEENWSGSSGYENIELQHGGFLVDVEDLGEGNFRVTLTPSTIYSPREGDYVKDSVLIAWDGTFESASLAYRKGTCAAGTTGILKERVSTIGSYGWDTSDLDDGEYCIKLVDGSIVYDEVKVIKDTTPPIIEFDKEFWFTEANQTVVISGEISDNEELMKMLIDYGDGTDDSGALSSNSQSFSLDHKYIEEGEYTVTVTAQDEANNVGSNSVNVIVSMEEPDWIIPLYANKANLISIPFVPEDTNYQEVLKGIKCNLDKIWAYQFNEETNKNEWVYKTVSSSCGWDVGGLQEIVPGYGYYVFMKNEDVLYGNAKAVSNSEPELPASIKLANEWNLIGHFGDIPKSIPKALASLTSLGGEQYWYKLYDVNHQEFTENMTSGEGYWVAMKHLPDTSTEDYYTYYS